MQNLKKMILCGLALCALLGATAVYAQGMDKSKQKKRKSLQSHLEQGKWGVQLRNYFMASDHHNPELSDAYANATGAAISYQAGKRFQVGFMASTTYRLFSSDLSRPDPLTGRPNRYEIGLFNIEKPESRIVNRLEELYVAYTWRRSSLTFGKQSLNTPFVNAQDSRMRPNFQEGIYLKWQDIPHLRVELGWIYRFLVRSTEQWASIPKSIGKYNVGVTPEGVRSEYRDNLSGAGLGIVGVTYEPLPGFKTQLWNYYVENIFNTSFLQTDWEFGEQGAPMHWLLGMQWAYQQALNQGGNPNPVKAYMPADHESWMVSTRIGWKTPHRFFTISYTHIGAQGRWVFPREWGLEPFYTRMPRERNEGSGGVHAIAAQLNQKLSESHTRIEIGYGHYYLPSPIYARLNKYNFPSYNQFNINLIHDFQGMLEGLRAQLLYIYKGRLEQNYTDPIYEFNKVNMSLYNVVINYSF